MAKKTYKASAFLGPIPAVLVSCGTVEKPHALTIAWTGIINTNPPKTYISVRPERHSYPIIKKSGEFVINLTTVPMVKAVDFCGVRSGKDIDKFTQCKLTAEPSTQLRAPMIAQSPVSIECKVSEIKELGSHNMIIADIVAINVEESITDEKGKFNMKKADCLAYLHGRYYQIGRELGTFGFSVMKKSTAKRKRELSGKKR